MGSGESLVNELGSFAATRSDVKAVLNGSEVGIMRGDQKWDDVRAVNLKMQNIQAGCKERIETSNHTHVLARAVADVVSLGINEVAGCTVEDENGKSHDVQCAYYSGHYTKNKTVGYAPVVTVTATPAKK